MTLSFTSTVLWNKYFQLQQLLFAAWALESTSCVPESKRLWNNFWSILQLKRVSFWHLWQQCTFLFFYSHSFCFKDAFYLGGYWGCFSLLGRTVLLFFLKNSCMCPTCAVPACKDIWHSPTGALNHGTQIIQIVSLQPLMWKCKAKLTYKKPSHSAGANYQITINYQIANVQE